MKRKFFTLSMIIFALMLGNFVAGQSTKADQKLKEQVQALNDKLAKASVKGDLEAAASIYADDVAYLPNYTPMIRGKAGMIEHEKKMQESGSKITAMKLTTMEVHDMGSMVYEIGSYEITMKMSGMDQPISDKGKYVSIYRKLKDGGLEMVVDIWNTDMNPWEEKK